MMHHNQAVIDALKSDLDRYIKYYHSTSSVSDKEYHSACIASAAETLVTHLNAGGKLPIDWAATDTEVYRVYVFGTTSKGEHARMVFHIKPSSSVDSPKAACEELKYLYWGNYSFPEWLVQSCIKLSLKNPVRCSNTDAYKGEWTDK